jgi:hypothetical protein
VNSEQFYFRTLYYKVAMVNGLIYYHMRAKVFASLLLCRVLFLERLQEVMNVIAILHSLYGFLEFVFLQLSC